MKQVRMIQMFRNHLQNMLERYVDELEACLRWSEHLAIEFRKRYPNED